MAKQESFRVLIDQSNNVTGNTWDIQLNSDVNGDLNNITVGAIFISDEGSQNYYRWKVVDVDTDGAPSGNTRWFRVSPDEAGTPPVAGPSWSFTCWIMNPLSATSVQGWKAFPEEQSINNAMDAYAINEDKYAIEERVENIPVNPMVFDAFVGPTETYTTIKSAFDAGARKIFIRNGNYLIDEDILQPSTPEDIYLEGESEGNVKITLDIPTPNYKSVFDFRTNLELFQVLEKFESPFTYDSTTKIFTFASEDPSLIFSPGDIIRTNQLRTLTNLEVTAVDSTSLTIASYEYPYIFDGGKRLSLIKRPLENTMSSFSMKNLTFIEAETNNQYLFATDGDENSWFSETIFKNCHFYGKGGTSAILG